VGAVGLGALASADDHHDGDATGDLGVGGDPSVLAIGPGETYTVENTETYRGVNWAARGELNLSGDLEF
jgi:hypothetical protein